MISPIPSHPSNQSISNVHQGFPGLRLPFRPSGHPWVQAPHVDDAPCKIEIRHLCQVPAVANAREFSGENS